MHHGCLFDFKNEDVYKDENIREFVNTNVATIPYEVFGKVKTYQFTEMKDVSELTNPEILQELIRPILQDGYDILVRDVSSFGFPSFRIIIPGMTEITHSKMAGRFSMFEEIEYLLKDFRRIDMKNLDRVIEILETQINEVGFTSLYTFLNIKDIRLIPCETIGNSTKYFLAMCYIMKGEYEKAEKALEEILLIANHLIPNGVEHMMLQAVYYYSSAMNKLKNHEAVMEYMKLLFDEEFAVAIDDNFRKPDKILQKHYSLKLADYVENDDAYYLPYMKILRQMQKTNIIKQNRLEEVFGKVNIKETVACI